MKKRSVWSGIILLIVFVSFGLIWLFSKEEHPATDITRSIPLDDPLVLHFQISGEEEQLRVKSSLQYTGDKEIILVHQTPLISVSYHKNAHRFSGGYVSQRLDSGSVYNQPVMELDAPVYEGEFVYFQVRYQIDGEEKVFEHEEKITYEG